MNSRAVAWIGVAVSLALVIVALVGITGCKPVCPAGQHYNGTICIDNWP